MLKQLIEEERWQDLRAIANDEVVEGIYPHGFSMDIGVDTHPEFKPYSFEEIKAYMERVEASGMERWQDRL
jgi:gamma-glutamyl-gamma-aminobutyrate hydrolase PuuD